MKKLLILFYSALALQGSAQQTDSSRYYRWEIMRLRHASDSALRASEAYSNAMAGLERSFEKRSTRAGYGGFILHSGLLHTDFREFNESIGRSGFPPMNELSAILGWGFAFKNNRTHFDIIPIAASTRSKSKKGDTTISASLSNALQLDIGVDLLRSGVLSIYPYAGLSIRGSDIKYETPVGINPAYTNITNIVSTNRTVELLSTRLGYQAGLGIDITLGEKPKRGTTTIFFVKGGVNRPFGKDKYRYGGQEVGPVPRQGDWTVTFGFKLAFLNR